ncbi:MAG: FecR family protein, partial [Gemmatimonadales bacterium]
MTPHLPPDDLPWEALARHFAGELDASGDDELGRWIAADPGRQELVEDLRHIWAETGNLRQSWDAETALRRIKAVPAGPAQVIRLPKLYHQEPLTRWRRAGRIAVRVAAGLALIVGGARVWQETARQAAPAPSPATSEVATPRGQRAVLRLPDGTRVMLGPASVLRHAVAPDHGARTVELEGEAYFTVIHDSTRPFAVHT